jgi:threonine aldolase
MKKLVVENNLLFHCDGARLWNACAATGISPKEYAEPFDTLSVCLSKGLGAPVGSVIVGPKEKITKALKWRKILGGGMRQAGILAAAGLHALKEHFKLLPLDHEHAKMFGSMLAESEYFQVDQNRIETNMVFFKYPSNVNDADLVRLCREKGLLISTVGNSTVRAVFHFQVSEEQTKEAANIIKDVVHGLA